MSAPMIPPRPTRAHSGPTAVKQDIPQIPPRPVRKSDPSPDRENYTRSPLNFLPTTNGTHFKPPPQAADDAPRRPPSVSLPATVGQEGMEYSSYDQLPPEAHGVKDTGSTATAADPETKNVSADVPLHQPKASVPQSTAKSRISTVTRTDSTQAAAAGIGRAQPDDDVHKGPVDAGTPLSRVTSRTQDDHLRRVPSAEPHPLKNQTSFNRSTSSLQNGTPRPMSVHSTETHEHFEGIPEIGMQIPLYPNAGDVQAPSPAPTQAQFSSGIGFFNDGSARAHHRKRSSRHEFGPPGSYGLHGHGMDSQDQFEKAWLARHPDEALKEVHKPYLLRPETALSSEQLNRIVSQEDIGMGTSPNVIGTPTQEIAFEATNAYASRHSSPKPSPAPLTELRQKRSSSDHLPPTESPLRKQSFAWNDPKHMRGEKALESEDEDAVHIDPPVDSVNKVTGGGSVDNKVDLGPKGGNTEEEGGWYIERGEGTPILASDEIMKRPSSAFLQPAVDPEEAYHDDSYYDSEDLPPSRRSSLKPPSRPSSRPGSMHGGYQGGPLHRFISHDDHGSGKGAPLEEIEEYEPLFPEEENEETSAKRVFKKRPGLAAHHFPSQDIWEDSPNSLQYQATVHTPEPPLEPAPDKIAAAHGSPAKVFETPEQEEARRTQNPADMMSDAKTFAKPHFKPGVRDELNGRPGVQRFPSQDIWEDTPSSMMFVTTVSSPQMDETKSPPEDRPTTEALPSRQDDSETRSTTGYPQATLERPSVPSRPERKSKLAQEITHDEKDPREREVPDLGTYKEQVFDRSKPTIPERPKPLVPARPARPSHSEHAEGAPLSKTTSADSVASDDTVTSPPAQKVKPAVPARPAGGKIATLQSTFMNDLNNRLKLGPQIAAPKATEPEPEAVEAPKEPLADARKSRAKGPARRKPAASPAPDAADTPSSSFSFSALTTLWQIDENDELKVASAEAEPATAPGTAPRHSEEHAATSGEPAPQAQEVEPMAALERALSANEAENTKEPAMKIRSESVSTEAADATNPREVMGAEGDKPAPAISSPVINEEPQEMQPGFEKALAQAEPASANAEEQEAKEAREMAGSNVQTGQEDVEVASTVDEK